MNERQPGAQAAAMADGRFVAVSEDDEARTRIRQ